MKRELMDKRLDRERSRVAILEKMLEDKTRESFYRLDQLSALRSIDKSIIGSVDIELTLEIIVTHTMSQLKVDAVDILLYKPHLEMLEYAAGGGFVSRALRHTRLKIGSSYAGRAALERSTVHIPDLKKGGTGFKRSKYMDEEGFITYYGVPLVSKGEIKGVMEVFDRSRTEREPDWVDFLETLAGQAAIAIDNASLFEKLQRANTELTLSYDETLEGWARALDLRDRETEGHSRRVTDLTMRVAQAMSIHDADQAHMRRGALLHDIGKMGIPDRVLLKPGPLDENEWELMRRHPALAHELLYPIAYLRPALEIPYCHHEKWDGTGYPQGLTGERIPLSARIFAAVDIYDAMTSDRPYREALPEEQVMEHLDSISGSHLDPSVMEVFQYIDKDIST